MCMLLNQAEEKDHFYEQLIVLVTSVAPSEPLVIAADFDGHAVQHSQGSVSIMVGMVMEHRFRKG